MTLLTYVAALTALVLLPWLAAQRLAEPVDGPDARATFEAARARHARRALLRRADASALPVLARTWPLARTVACVVPVEQIVGSVDRGPHPFDRRFDPITDSAWARFASVLRARLDGLELPPVLLQEGGDGYYVLDGHHRLAVARALGDTVIRAEVAVRR
jgi:hypothetical protein